MFQRIEKKPIEYHLNVFHAVDWKTKKPVIRFHFETQEEFHYFQYLISIESNTNNGHLDFKIRGLKPQVITLPQDGPAVADIDLPYMTGKFVVNITKPGNILNSFVLNIDDHNIEMIGTDTTSLTFLNIIPGEIQQ
jgi:hypothetical protein